MVDWSKPVECKGRPVKVLCTDGPHSEYPVVLIGRGYLTDCRKDGTGSWLGPITNTPKTHTFTGTAYLYKQGVISIFKAPGKDLHPDVIASKPITFEITEGEGL